MVEEIEVQQKKQIVRYDKQYRERRRAKGYLRIHKWVPQEYKADIDAIFDLLGCHYEDPESTSDFHYFIDLLRKNAALVRTEYEVEDDQSV